MKPPSLLPASVIVILYLHKFNHYMAKKTHFHRKAPRVRRKFCEMLKKGNGILHIPERFGWLRQKNTGKGKRFGGIFLNKFAGNTGFPEKV